MVKEENNGVFWRNSLKKHFLITLFSLVSIVIVGLISNESIFDSKYYLLFGLIFFQLEAFIWLGMRLFDFSPGNTPKEITWNIVIRFVIFYLSCFVIAAILFTVMLALLYYIKGEPLDNFFSKIIEWEFKGWFKSTNIGLTFGAFVFFLMQWQDALKREQKLREEKLTFQYETLNQQVNPHFLFNSLNTLSSFIGSKPDIAEEYVEKLSSTYRYIIDNVSKNNVLLNEELQFIKDYFYLHKLRDDDKIDLKINIDEDNNYQIIPVSLQILIENALKHNMATKTSPLIIEVFIENETIVVTNNLQKMSTLETSLKKGLKNLNERVKLTTGKQTEIIEDNKNYKVKIPLLQ